MSRAVRRPRGGNSRPARGALLLGAVVFFAVAGPSFAAPAPEADAARGVMVSGHEDWRAWPRKNFPDASRAWPAA